MIMKPTVDFAFKKIFGNEKKPEILIGFLNAVLECPEEDCITWVDIRNPNNDKEFSEESYSILDIKARTNRQELIHIEIQIGYDQSMIKRSLFYCGRMLSGQSRKSAHNYNSLDNVVCIVIMDYLLRDLAEENFHTVCYLTSQESKRVVTKGIAMHYIQLPKIDFSKITVEKEVWFDFIKNPEKYVDNPVKSMKNMALGSAVAELSRLSLDVEEREQYFAREKQIHDHESQVASAREEGLARGMTQGISRGKEIGRAEGIEEGLAQGERRKQLEIARNLLDVLDNETIALKTNLSIGEIEALR